MNLLMDLPEEGCSIIHSDPSAVMAYYFAGLITAQHQAGPIYAVALTDQGRELRLRIKAQEGP